MTYREKLNEINNEIIEGIKRDLFISYALWKEREHIIYLCDSGIHSYYDQMPETDSDEIGTRTVFQHGH